MCVCMCVLHDKISRSYKIASVGTPFTKGKSCKLHSTMKPNCNKTYIIHSRKDSIRKVLNGEI